MTEQEKLDAENFAETMLTNESLEQAHTQDFEEEDDEANRLLFERGRRGVEREDEDGDKSDDSDDESYQQSKQRPFPKVDEQQDDFLHLKEGLRRNSQNRSAQELDFSNVGTENAKRQSSRDSLKPSAVKISKYLCAQEEQRKKMLMK